jgi:glycosyltransferase involved in cell wall biosynthesis
VEHATQEWVAFLDSDDQWLPTKLDKQFALHLEDSELSISQTAEIWINQGVRFNQRKHHAPAQGMCFERCLDICCISASAVMIRRRLLVDEGGFDVTLPVCEDYDLWIRLTRKLAVGFVDEALVLKTRSGEGQLSQSVEAIDHYRVLALMKLIETGLNDDELALARRALDKKLSILIQGARKRGRNQEVEHYGQILKNFCSVSVS